MSDNFASAEKKRTFGPSYDKRRDGKRIKEILYSVRDVMLAASIRNEWLTIDEIKQRVQLNLGRTVSWGSVDATVRHWRKPEFGSYRVEPRKRGNISEYRMTVPCKLPELTLFDRVQQDYSERLGR